MYIDITSAHKAETPVPRRPKIAPPPGQAKRVSKTIGPKKKRKKDSVQVSSLQLPMLHEPMHMRPGLIPPTSIVPMNLGFEMSCAFSHGRETAFG